MHAPIVPNVPKRSSTDSSRWRTVPLTHLRVDPDSIRAEMARRRITNRYLAQQSGVSFATVSRFVNGWHIQSPITIGLLLRTLEEFGVPIDKVTIHDD